MKILLISLLLFGIFLTALPYGIKLGMKQALLKQGLESVQIQDVSFNLFTGRFKVENMTLKKAGKAPLTLGEFFIDFDWPSLFAKHLVIDKVILLNTHLFIHYKPNEFIDVAGISIPLNQTEKPDSPESAPLTWKLGLNSLVLRNSVVNVIAPNIDKNIRFNEVALNRLQNWAPDNPADITFKVAVGEKNVYGGFKGHLKINAFSDTQKIIGKITVDNLLLQAYQKLLPPEVKQLAAKVEGTVDVTASNHFGDIQAQLSSNLSVEGGAVQTAKLQASVQNAALNGQSDITIHSSNVVLKNNVNLTVEQAALDNAGLQLEVGEVTLNSQHQMALKNKGLTFDSEDALTVHNANLKQKDQQLNLKNVSWKGKLASQLMPPKNQSTNEQAAKLDVNGQLQLSGLKLMQQALVLSGEQLQWKGNTQVSKAASRKGSVVIDTNGQLNLADWILSNTKQKLTMASFKTLATQLRFHSPQAVSLKNLQLNKITLAQLNQAKTKREKHPLVFINALSLSRFNSPNANQLSVGKVTLNNMNVSLDFDEDHKIHQVQYLKASLPKPQASGAKPKPSKKAPKHSATKNDLKWNFEGLQLTGKNTIELLTHATQPSMHKNILIKELSFGKVNEARPKYSTPFKLKATVDKYTKLSVEGKVKPLTPKVNIEAKTQIDDMDLYSFSPLIRRDMGYRIQSGSLNLTSDVKVKDDMLTSKNHVVLIGFEMEANDREKPKQNVVTETSSTASGLMSASALKFGLDMLRDSHDNIDLNLPVEGNLADPGFDASSAVNAALKNALTGGTKLALTLALQPYGAIAMVTSYAYDKINQIQFQSVAFVSGKNELSPGMPEYLDKMGKLLKQKPQISLKVCGYYTQQDIDSLTKAIQSAEEKVEDKQTAPLDEEQQAVLKQRLYDLAKARQRLVKDWLVEKGGIAPIRLTTCHPELQQETVTGVSLSM